MKSHRLSQQRSIEHEMNRHPMNFTSVNVQREKSTSSNTQDLKTT